VKKGVAIAINILAIFKANILYNEKRSANLRHHFSDHESTFMLLKRIAFLRWVLKKIDNFKKCKRKNLFLIKNNDIVRLRASC
jgi:hypothetical protein